MLFLIIFLSQQKTILIKILRQFIIIFISKRKYFAAFKIISPVLGHKQWFKAQSRVCYKLKSLSQIPLFCLITWSISWTRTAKSWNFVKVQLDNRWKYLVLNQCNNITRSMDGKWTFDNDRLAEMRYLIQRSFTKLYKQLRLSGQNTI